MNSGFSVNLDVLRSIAVLLVFTQHILRRLYIDKLGWVDTSCLGLFGVLLFFVHTTFVLMESLERAEERGEGLYASFYIRRIFRIFPLSIITVLAALSLHLDSDVNGIRGLSTAPMPGQLTIAANLGLFQNLVAAKSIVNVLWTLPFELQMYLLLPFVYLLARRRKPWWILGLWGACLPFSIWLTGIHFGAAGPRALSLLQFVPNFLPGAIAFALLAKMKPRIPAWIWPFFIVLLFGVFTLSKTSLTGWLLCLVLGCALPAFRETRTIPVKWLAGRVATYSYGIYLTHQFCIWFSLGLLAGAALWIRVLVLVGTLVGLPVVFYHGIESPMIRAGKILASRFSTPVALARQSPLVEKEGSVIMKWFALTLFILAMAVYLYIWHLHGWPLE